MRKVLPFILILFVLSTALLPVGFGGNKFTIKNLFAQEDKLVISTPSASDISASQINFELTINNIGSSFDTFKAVINENADSDLNTKDITSLVDTTKSNQTIQVTFDNLTLASNTDYYLSAKAYSYPFLGGAPTVIKSNSIKFTTSGNVQDVGAAQTYGGSTSIGGSSGSSTNSVPEVASAPPKIEDNLPLCDLGISVWGSSSGSDSSSDSTSTGTFYGCVIQGFYYAIWMPTSWLAGLAAKFLDYFLFYSIQSESYSGSSFVSEGWMIVRDFANIAFIFVLLYIAIKTILGLAGSDGKRGIVMVIIMALLINFSLFFTRVVVDSGNILAAVMYNNVTTSTVKDGQTVNIAKGEIGEEQVSVALVNNFDPQKIFLTSNLASATDLSLRTPFLIVIILSAIINVVMIYVFFAVGFLFVGRVLGLMLSMIFSPFAFISLAIPGGSSFMKKWGWSEWFKDLIQLTLLAPIFIFFLYLIIKFTNTGFIKNIGTSLVQNGTTFGNFMIVILPFALVMGLLLKAKSLATELGGEIGAAINKIAGTAVMAVGGVALGATALAGRATIGRAASSIATRGATSGAAAEEATVTRVPLQPSISPGARYYFRQQREAAQRGPRLPGGPEDRGGRGGPEGGEGFPRPIIGPTPLGPRPEGRGPGAGSERSTRNPEEAAQLFRTPEQTQRLSDRVKEQTEQNDIEDRLRRSGLVLATPSSVITPPTPPTPSTSTETPPPASSQPVLKTTPSSTTSESKPETKIEESSAGGTVGSNQDTKAQETIKNIAQKEEAKIQETVKAENELRNEAESMQRAGTSTSEYKMNPKTLKDYAAAAPTSAFGIRSVADVKNTIGKQAFNLANYLGSASFDLRNTKLMKQISKSTGLDFGSAGGKGGFQKMQKDIIEKEID